MFHANTEHAPPQRRHETYQPPSVALNLHEPPDCAIIEIAQLVDLDALGRERLRVLRLPHEQRDKGEGTPMHGRGDI